MIIQQTIQQPAMIFLLNISKYWQYFFSFDITTTYRNSRHSCPAERHAEIFLQYLQETPAMETVYPVC